MGPIANLPDNGTPVIPPTVQTPYLQPNTGYSMHVRCLCEDNKVKQKSGWSSVDFTTTDVLGISNTTTEVLQIEAYPNPVKDVLNIKATGLKGSADVQISDVKGRVLNTLTISATQTTVNVSSYPSGVYILQYTDNDKVHNIKFTKQ